MRFAVIRLTLLLTVSACGSVGTQQSSSGSAVLSWDPVTVDTSGNPLQDLAGYEIHYGTSAEAMSIVEMLTDPNQTTYTVNHLSPGTWYFAVNAYTTAGSYSGLSNVASKTIN
ncbi:MAG TPA: fibronectin type III domain-containing protein [Steroidobacteraceae bacterium]|nr:fibronectin type III domain-containing protein [Steroidobacteraceae bacterium]